MAGNPDISKISGSADAHVPKCYTQLEIENNVEILLISDLIGPLVPPLSNSSLSSHFKGSKFEYVLRGWPAGMLSV